MADKVVQLKNKDGDKLYPVSVLPGERILWEDTMEPAPTMENIEDMTGATASAAGKHGLVPAPAAGDQNKFLMGDGTWGDGVIQDITSTVTRASGCNINQLAVLRMGKLVQVFMNIESFTSSIGPDSQNQVATGLPKPAGTANMSPLRFSAGTGNSIAFAGLFSIDHNGALLLSAADGITRNANTAIWCCGQVIYMTND